MSAGGKPHTPTRTGARPPVRVILCGELLRADDGAPFLAAERLPSSVARLAEVRRVGQLDVQDLLDVPEGGACVLVDTAVGVPAGRVVVVPLSEVARGEGAAPRSSHSLPPDPVLALAATLRGGLPEGSFVGLGGRSFGIGEPLSPEVQAAIGAFAAAIGDEVVRLAR